MKSDVTNGLLRCYEMISQCYDYNELLIKVNTKASLLLGLESVTLYCLLPEKQMLLTRYKDTAIPLNINKLKGIIQIVYNNGQSIIIPELKNDIRFDNQFDIISNSLNVHSVMYLPLFKVTGQMVGIIIFAHSNSSYFDGNVEIYNNLSNHIAYCLDKSIQLHYNIKHLKENGNEIEKKKNELSKMEKEINELRIKKSNSNTPVDLKMLSKLQSNILLLNSTSSLMNLISTKLFVVLKCEKSELYLCDKNTKSLWTINKRNDKVMKSYERGSFKYMISTGKLELFDNCSEDIRCDRDYDNCKNLICCPIKSENGNILGIIRIENKESNFGENDINIINLVSSEISIVLQRIRNAKGSLSMDKGSHLQDIEIQKLEIENDNRHLKELNDFYINLLPIHSLNDFFIICEDEISKLLKCESCCIYLLESNGSILNSRNGYLSIGNRLIPELITYNKYIMKNDHEECLEYLSDLKLYFNNIEMYRNFLIVPLCDIYNKISVIIFTVNKINNNFGKDDMKIIGDISEKLLLLLDRIQMSNLHINRYLFYIYILFFFNIF